MFKSPLFERWWPFGVTLIAVAFWFWMGSPFPKNPDGLFGAAATVASVFASFLGVSKAIILTIKSSKTYRVLKAANQTQALFAYLRAGIFTSVVFAALSILGFFVSREYALAGHGLFQIFAAIWVFSALLAMFTYLRISHILFKILQID